MLLLLLIVCFGKQFILQDLVQTSPLQNVFPTTPEMPCASAASYTCFGYTSWYIGLEFFFNRISFTTL